MNIFLIEEMDDKWFSDDWHSQFAYNPGHITKQFVLHYGLFKIILLLKIF